MARTTGGSVRLFQAVFVPQEFPPAAHVEAQDVLAPYARDQGRRRLSALQLMAGSVPCDIEVEESMDPPAAILGAADRYAADLIVVGSHGYTTLDHVLGTTAAKIVNHSRRDVLVLHRCMRVEHVSEPPIEKESSSALAR
jgi:nucleotide-binding universal stress UspA family protein